MNYGNTVSKILALVEYTRTALLSPCLDLRQHAQLLIHGLVLDALYDRGAMTNTYF